ncbi:MAG: hypothetical protein WCI05_10685, partial [Myxococcales bacterium]
MRKRSRCVHAVYVASATLVACASSGSDNPSADGGANDSGYVPVPGCVATKPFDEDPIDPEFLDENCDGSDGVLHKCIFVAADGDDANDGARLAPMKTIAQGITKAGAQSKSLCLAAETFSGTVAMIGGVSVYGGFNEKAPFAFHREKGAETILTNAGTVVAASAINTETHLEGVSLRARTPTQAGEGAYGVRLSGGTAPFVVRYNVIAVGDGQAGTAGTKGDDGSAGINGNDGSVGEAGCATPAGRPGALGVESTCAAGFSGDGGRGGNDDENGVSGTTLTGGGTGGAGGSKGSTTTLICTPKTDGGDGAPGQPPAQAGTTGSDAAKGTERGALDSVGRFVGLSGPKGGDGGPGANGGGGGGAGGR